MVDKEERIAVVSFQGDFLRTQAEWKREGKYPAYRLRNVYGITRAEAVEIVAKEIFKAEICEESGFNVKPNDFDTNDWNKRWANLSTDKKRIYYAVAEAVLDVLLGKGDARNSNN